MGLPGLCQAQSCSPQGALHLRLLVVSSVEAEVRVGRILEISPALLCQRVWVPGVERFWFSDQASSGTQPSHSW